MLKKTGIIAAAAAAGVLGLSSLAFATTGGDDHGHGSSNVEYSSVERDNLSNDCEFAQDGGTVDQNLTGGSSLLDVGGAVTGAAAPVQTATQALNCTNLNLTDVVDIGSGNTTETRTETEIEGSGNTAEG